MFSDNIFKRINSLKTPLCAGIDLDLDKLPSDTLKQFSHLAFEEQVEKSFIYSLNPLFEAISDKIATVKPNIAFFEQYGVGGLRALKALLKKLAELNIPSILDCKRGDIGNTASKYASAYLEENNLSTDFLSSAITVNPYLGFDSLKPYLDNMRTSGRALFILVKTSNQGSMDLQGDVTDQNSCCYKIANWIHSNSKSFLGASGFSNLGAVVGATHPQEAKLFRELMPNSYFLIPGVGAQGGSIKDAMESFNKDKQGGIINVSRGLFSSADINNNQKWINDIQNNIIKFNQQFSAI